MKTHYLRIVKAGTGMFMVACGTKTYRSMVTHNAELVTCLRCSKIIEHMISEAETQARRKVEQV